MSDMPPPPLSPTPPQMPSPSPLSSATFGSGVAGDVVSADTPCRKCGYNLRGLTIDGRCPECGTPVGVSVHGKLLRFSDPRWVRMLQRGCRLIIAAVAVAILGGILSMLLAAAVGMMGGVLFALLMLLAYGLMLIGSWLLTEPDPSGVGEDKYGTARKIIRFALIVGVINTALDLIPAAVTLAPQARMAFDVLGLIGGLISIVGLFAQLDYLEKLARRIPDDALAGRAHFLKYAFGISFALFLVLSGILAIAARTAAAPGAAVAPLGCVAGILGIAMLIFSIMYLLLVERLGKRFGLEAQAAEQSWARGQGAAEAAPPAA